MLCGRVVISSGSEGDDGNATMDERKRKRMMSNRESARRSRMRKEEHVKELTRRVSDLKRRNNDLVQQSSNVSQVWLGVESENMVLRAQVGELKKRLESLEMVMTYVRGCSMTISHEDPLLKPLQVSSQFTSIKTPLLLSAATFKF